MSNDFLENFENNNQQEKEENTVDIKRKDSIGNLNCDIGNPFGEPWSNLIEKIKRMLIINRRLRSKRRLKRKIINQIKILLKKIIRIDLNQLSVGKVL